MLILERVIIDVISSIICFILVIFMYKPFQLAAETRYLYLPLGFGFLGISYAFSALSFSPILYLSNNGWVQLYFRAFSFLFLALTYYFSKSERKPKLLWNTTLFALIAILIILIMLAIFSPEYMLADYLLAQVYVRAFDVICLVYISIHALKSHLEQPKAKTLIIPFGYIFLGIGQYSVLIWAFERNALAFWIGLALRLTGLLVFLFVSIQTFYTQIPGGIHDTHFA